MLGEARRAPTGRGYDQYCSATAANRCVTAAPARRPQSSPLSTTYYTVQSGDSLSTISRKVYGTPSRWIDIYQANRDRLSSENALRVGQALLRIP